MERCSCLLSLAASYQLAGIGNGRQHVAVVGDALAGNVESCAVVNRGAVNREIDGDVYSRIESDELDRDMALIVVLRDDQVEAAGIGTVEHGVCRDRAVGVDAFGAGGSH